MGEHAPTKDRRIVNRDVTKMLSGATGGLVADNQWLADDEVLIDEQLRADVRVLDGINVLDLEYTLTPTTDLKLARWAFSGFCVRTPPRRQS